MSMNLTEIIKGIVESVADGGGKERGLGRTTQGTISMTAATECYYGTSGRGSALAKSKIRDAARLGFLRVQRMGRVERVSITEKGLALLS